MQLFGFRISGKKALVGSPHLLHERTLFYIAQEIDQPFGEDPNDLPVVQMQSDFNHKLKLRCRSGRAGTCTPPD